jgi:hypothetical protein
MKKIIGLLLILALAAALLCGCGNDESKPAENGNGGAAAANVPVSRETPAEKFDYRAYDDHVEIKGYLGEEPDVVIPAKIEGKPVQYVTIEENEIVRSVVFPEGIDNVWSMKNCSNLEKATLPSTVKKIWKSAFRGTALKEINLPEGLEEIDSYAFRDTQLTRIVFPQSLKGIGENAFSGTGITELEIPSGVSLNYEAFKECDALKKITFHNTDDNMNPLQIPSLEEAIVAEGCTKLRGQMFRDCKNLTSVSLPSTLTFIGGNMFINCENLKDLTIPESVTQIEYGAFNHTTILHVKSGSYAETRLRDGLPNYPQDPYSNYVVD